MHRMWTGNLLFSSFTRTQQQIPLVAKIHTGCLPHWADRTTDESYNIQKAEKFCDKTKARDLREKASPWNDFTKYLIGIQYMQTKCTKMI